MSLWFRGGDYLVFLPIGDGCLFKRALIRGGKELCCNLFVRDISTCFPFVCTFLAKALFQCLRDRQIDEISRNFATQVCQHNRKQVGVS